jgi:hypothetical protein
VVALQLTWKLRFSENITDVDLNALSQRLEHVSQEKEFGSNLSQVGELMRSEWHEMEWDDELGMTCGCSSCVNHLSRQAKSSRYLRMILPSSKLL